LRRKKTPPAAGLKKKLGGTEWKKEWPHFEEEKNTFCCRAKKKAGMNGMEEGVPTF
jgi:hypothetical protein